MPDIEDPPDMPDIPESKRDDYEFVVTKLLDHIEELHDHIENTQGELNSFNQEHDQIEDHDDGDE